MSFSLSFYGATPRHTQTDAYDSVRRAFIETWHLAFELRMSDSSGKAAKWLARGKETWSADIKKLERYSKSREKDAAALGRYYGELSEMAHPTLSAAENSVSLMATRHGVNIEADSIERPASAFEKELLELLYRFLWLILDHEKSFIQLYVDETKIPHALEFANKHPHM